MIRIIFILTLVCVITPAAVASETDWNLYLRASTTDYRDFTDYIKCGTKTGATNGYDEYDHHYTANTGSQAQVVVYKPWWPDIPPYYWADMRAPFTFGSTGGLSWEMRVWAGPDYTSDTLRVGIWSISNYYLPERIDGIVMCYGITVVDDPTGTYQSGTNWFFGPEVIGYSTDPGFYIDFNNVSSIKMSDNEAGVRGIKLRFGAGNDWYAAGYYPDTPEPSSLLALGSGLIGLVGFRIRRKR